MHKTTKTVKIWNETLVRRADVSRIIDEHTARNRPCAEQTWRRLQRIRLYLRQHVRRERGVQTSTTYGTFYENDTTARQGAAAARCVQAYCLCSYRDDGRRKSRRKPFCRRTSTMLNDDRTACQHTHGKIHRIFFNIDVLHRFFFISINRYKYRCLSSMFFFLINSKAKTAMTKNPGKSITKTT